MWENVGECGNVGETGKVVQVWTGDVVIHLGENVGKCGTGYRSGRAFNVRLETVDKGLTMCYSSHFTLRNMI